MTIYEVTDKLVHWMLQKCPSYDWWYENLEKNCWCLCL